MFNSILANFASSSPTLFLLRRAFAEFATRQFFTVGQQEFADHADGRPLFAGRDGDGDDFAWFQELRIPAGSLQDRGSQGFDAPIHGFARVVLDVEENLAMGIGPIIFGNGTLESFEIFCVVLGPPVVGPEHTASSQKATKHSERKRQLRFHLTPLESSDWPGNSFSVREYTTSDLSANQWDSR